MTRIAAWALILGLAAPSPALADEPGEAVFKRACAVCHSLDAGKNKIGPSLAGIVGRRASSVEGYGYSAAAKKSGVVWDETQLDAYLADPQKFMPGTKKTYAGLKGPADRSAVIAYLKRSP